MAKHFKAILLRLDLNRIYAAEGEERMTVFLRMIERLPSNIIFTETPRLCLNGFSWAPSTFLTNAPLRLRSNLNTDGVDCTSNGLLGEYICFRPNISTPAMEYTPSKRHTIIDNTSSEKRWFDVWDPKKGSFVFSHIVILSKEIPPSTRGTIFIAAAVLQVESPLGYAMKEEGSRIDLICGFKTVVFLAVVREFMSPPNRGTFDSNPRIIEGKFEKFKLLIH